MAVQCSTCILLIEVNACFSLRYWSFVVFIFNSIKLTTCHCSSWVTYRSKLLALMSKSHFWHFEQHLQVRFYFHNLRLFENIFILFALEEKSNVGVQCKFNLLYSLYSCYISKYHLIPYDIHLVYACFSFDLFIHTISVLVVNDSITNLSNSERLK